MKVFWVIIAIIVGIAIFLPDTATMVDMRLANTLDRTADNPGSVSLLVLAAFAAIMALAFKGIKGGGKKKEEKAHH